MGVPEVNVKMRMWMWVWVPVMMAVVCIVMMCSTVTPTTMPHTAPACQGEFWRHKSADCQRQQY
jgi:hypothetical protein